MPEPLLFSGNPAAKRWLHGMQEWLQPGNRWMDVPEYTPYSIPGRPEDRAAKDEGMARILSIFFKDDPELEDWYKKKLEYQEKKRTTKKGSPPPVEPDAPPGPAYATRPGLGARTLELANDLIRF